MSTSAGTLDILLETRWCGRAVADVLGRPLTYGTTEEFLGHFGLDSIKDLPGLAELKGAGLLDGNLPPGFAVPEPSDVAALMPDELPLENGEEQAEFALALAEDEAHSAGAGGRLTADARNEKRSIALKHWFKSPPREARIPHSPEPMRRAAATFAARLTFEHLGRRYDGTVALEDFSLDVAPGEVVCLLGPRAAARPRSCASPRVSRSPLPAAS